MATIIQDPPKALEAILFQLFKIVFKTLKPMWLLLSKVYWNH